jgi:cholesterol transport system auxiliary component
MLRLRRGFGIILLSVQLSGCAALGLLAPPAPPPTTYDLSARPSLPRVAEPSARLGVRIPNAIQLFDSERIVIRPETGLAAYYSDAQWTDRLPRLVEARLIEAFGAAGVRTVTRMTDGLTVDYQLLSEVRDFSVSNSAGDHTARVSIYVQLVSDKEGRTLTGREFTASAPISGGEGSAAAGVDALNDAFSQVLGSVVRWTLAKM